MERDELYYWNTVVNEHIDLERNFFSVLVGGGLMASSNSNWQSESRGPSPRPAAARQTLAQTKWHRYVCEVCGNSIELKDPVRYAPTCSNREWKCGGRVMRRVR